MKRIILVAVACALLMVTTGCHVGLKAYYIGDTDEFIRYRTCIEESSVK